MKNIGFVLILSVLESFIFYGQGKDLGKRAAYTQYATSGAEAALSELLVKNLGKPVGVGAEAHIKGSPYFNEIFVLGQVLYEDFPVDTLYMRYNAYQDEIQIKKTQNEREPFQALIKSSSVSCNLNHVDIVFRDFRIGRNEFQKGYLFKLVQGKEYSLYARKFKRLRPGKKASNSLAKSIDPRFIEEIDYYMVAPESTVIVRIPNPKRKFLKLFRTRDRELVNSAIQKFKYGTAYENELLQLFRSLNDQ